MVQKQREATRVSFGQNRAIKAAEFADQLTEWNDVVTPLESK
jgi:hypothetical protein